MIDFLSDWAEGIIVAVIIATIIEMILPNNKNKKYVKMIIGIYILFNVVSPFIKNSRVFSFENLDLDSYIINTSNDRINQESMDNRLQELYIEELEKNVKQKVEDKGYIVAKCKIDATLNENDKNAGINKIEIRIEGKKILDNINNNVVEMIDKIEIRVGNKNIKDSDSSKVSNQDLENVKKIISDFYEIDKRKINVSV